MVGQARHEKMIQKRNCCSEKGLSYRHTGLQFFKLTCFKRQRDVRCIMMFGVL